MPENIPLIVAAVLNRIKEYQFGSSVECNCNNANLDTYTYKSDIKNHLIRKQQYP